MALNPRKICTKTRCNRIMAQKACTRPIYQLRAYLRGSNHKVTAGEPIEGTLVYPVGEHRVDISYKIDGYPVRIYTLNLGQPWCGIESDLLAFVACAANWFSLVVT